VTKIKLEPIDWMLDWIEFCAPWPIEIMAITELMPMTMPRIVSPDLALLAERAVQVS